MNTDTAKQDLQKFISNNYLVKHCHTSFEDIRDSWIDGKCIVMSSGGMKYLTNAYLNIRYIRDVLKSNIPIQIWYLGEKEKISSVFDDLNNRYENIEFIDSEEVKKTFPFAKSGGWENKIYSIVHCKYKEVLYLDSDCFIDYQPEQLFEDLKEYKEYGAVFSSDCDVLGCHRPMDEKGVITRLGSFFNGVWDYSQPNPLLNILGIRDNFSCELESGFMLIDKYRCYKEVLLALYLNENSDFIYYYIYGDKDTYRLAWSYFNTDYCTITNVARSHNCISNYYNNKLLFQHRVQNTKFDINASWHDYPNRLPNFQKLELYKPFFDNMMELVLEFKNIYSDENYSIDQMVSHHNDKFSISLINNHHFVITRTDTDSGWGQNLILKIFNKKNNTTKIMNIGASNHNAIIKNI